MMRLTGVSRLTWPGRLALFACLSAGAMGALAQGRDPRNLTECVQMTRAPLEQRCDGLFGGPGQGEQHAACLGQVATHLRAVCEQFFGEGRDFCATCTSNCTEAFPAGEGKRGECLSMCLRQPGCQ